MIVESSPKLFSEIGVSIPGIIRQAVYCSDFAKNTHEAVFCSIILYKIDIIPWIIGIYCPMSSLQQVLLLDYP